MSNRPTHVRQGDVFLRRIDKVPVTKQHKHKTLAFGEVTGHHHEIIDGEVFVGDNGQLFVRATEDTRLRHQDEAGAVADHWEHDVPAGDYAVTIEEEYEPEGWRQVYD